MLDAFAGTDLSRVRALRSQLHALDEALAGLGGDAQQRAREADVLRYQVTEIAAAHLEDPDEEAGAAPARRTGLADAAAYREAALEALELVDPAGDEAGALDLLGRAGGALAGREAFDGYRARLAAAAVELSDLARSLRDEVEGWEDDPQRLGRGAGAPAAAGRAAAQVRRGPARRDGLRHARARPGWPRWRTPRARRPACRPSTTVRPAELARGRGGRARRPGPRRRRLRRTGGRAPGCAGHGRGPARGAGGAARARGSRSSSRSGPTSGEAVQPLARAASGGELARAMLAIRLVGLGGPQTMVFDEVDAGVGGAAALALGEALHEVGRRPPGAGRHPPGPGGVAGRRADQRGQGRVPGPHRDDARPRCQGEDRVTELSRMLSGHPDSDAARAHARELLGAITWAVVHHAFRRRSIIVVGCTDHST